MIELPRYLLWLTYLSGAYQAGDDSYVRVDVIEPELRSRSDT